MLNNKAGALISIVSGAFIFDRLVKKKKKPRNVYELIIEQKKSYRTT